MIYYYFNSNIYVLVFIRTWAAPSPSVPSGKKIYFLYLLTDQWENISTSIKSWLWYSPFLKLELDGFDTRLSFFVPPFLRFSLAQTYLTLGNHRWKNIYLPIYSVWLSIKVWIIIEKKEYSTVRLICLKILRILFCSWLFCYGPIFDENVEIETFLTYYHICVS